MNAPGTPEGRSKAYKAMLSNRTPAQAFRQKSMAGRLPAADLENVTEGLFTASRMLVDRVAAAIKDGFAADDLSGVFVYGYRLAPNVIGTGACGVGPKDMASSLEKLAALDSPFPLGVIFRLIDREAKLSRDWARPFVRQPEKLELLKTAMTKLGDKGNGNE